MSLSFSQDIYAKIEYNPQTNKYAFDKNVIGPEAAISIDEADYTYTDSNSIFVDSDTGSDSNAGTQAAPKATLLASIGACTSTKSKVLVLNTALYAENLASFTNIYFEGFYAATGETPTYTTRVLSFTPSDSNSIFVDKTGLDTNAGTQALPKLTIAGGVAAVDATHQAVVIQDSGTYTEPGVEFTGNFKKLVAAEGYAPVYNIEINPAQTEADIIKAETTFKNANINTVYSAVMSDDNFVLVYVDIADSHKGKFVIYDKDGTIVKSETTFTSNYIDHSILPVKTLSTDYFIIAFIDHTDSDKGKFVIYDKDGSVSKAITTFNNASTDYPALTILSDDNFIISFRDQGDSNKGKFIIYDNSGTIVKAETEFESNNSPYSLMGTFSDDNFVIIYYDGTDLDCNFVIYDKDGAVVKAKTQFYSGTTNIDFSLSVFSDDNFVIVYSAADDSNKGYFVIYDSSGTVVKSATNFESSKALRLSSGILSSKIFITTYGDTSGAYNEGRFIAYDSDGAAASDTKVFNAAATDFTTIGVFSDDNFFIAYRDFAVGGLGNFVIYKMDNDALKISTASEIDGLTLDVNDTPFIRDIGRATADLTIKNCELKNCTNSGSTTDAYGVYSDSDITMRNCIIHDNGYGFYTEADTSIIENNLFYRNSYGYAMHIKGAAASSGDITIEHNTIFNNYSGLYLESNNGTNELVKNNIIHGNNVYGIKATTNITYSYSINTDTDSGASAGTSVLGANPLFINEGDLVPANTNLKIKMRSLGYPADSPAYQLADDTTPDRDAGAWNIAIIGEATTWTGFTFEKPGGGMNLTNRPVGETRTTRKDGSVGTDVTAWEEEWSINFTGLRNAEYTNIMLMLTCGNSQIRFYPDYTTSPNDYNVYNLIYKYINAGARHFELTQTGRQNVKIMFARAYTA